MKSRVVITGARELRRDLKRVDAQLPKELRLHLKSAAGPVLADAKRAAPRRTGKLAGSLRITASAGGKVSIVSRKPYASIVHWGGRHPVFGNKERWVAVRPRPFIEWAAQRHVKDVEREIADAVEGLMRRAGFH